MTEWRFVKSETIPPGTGELSVPCAIQAAVVCLQPPQLFLTAKYVGLSWIGLSANEQYAHSQLFLGEALLLVSLVPSTN
ncbi:MAG: hypothetical protein CFH41_00783 [Alphaproteobacteria bacterium MarineAlpha11_Bin1]|nr:MAG: hypothetical protein CFH41_00783 [Alphaproteobacteria bacterium MarineAlpha11_Bin1]